LHFIFFAFVWNVVSYAHSNYLRKIVRQFFFFLVNANSFGIGIRFPPNRMTSVLNL